MKLFLAIIAIALLAATAVIAGRISHMEYNPNYMPYVVPMAGHEDVCIRWTAKCQGNVFLQCVAGKWQSADTCAKNEACTQKGCRMLRWSRYPYVKITPITMKPMLYFNATQRSMPVQVKI